MGRIQVGLTLKSLAAPLRQAVTQAHKLEVAGVELEAAGDLSPRSLSETGRRELRHLLRSHDLEATALHCPLRRGLDVAENQEPRIDHVKQVMSISFDLGPRRVTLFAGQVPEKPDDPRAPLLRDALTALGRHGDKVGVTLALETGLDSAAALAVYLDTFDSGSLAVCFNPGQLFMDRHDPYQAVTALGRRLIYARGTDARYAGASLKPVPFGQGDIDWLRLFGAFAEIDYGGWLVVDGNNAAEAGQAAALARRLVR